MRVVEAESPDEADRILQSESGVDVVIVHWNFKGRGATDVVCRDGQVAKEVKANFGPLNHSDPSPAGLPILFCFTIINLSEIEKILRQK